MDKNNVYTSDEEFEKARTAITRIHKYPTPFSNAAAAEIATSIGECKAYNTVFDFIEKMKGELDASKEKEISNLLFEMQLAKNQLLKGINISNI